MTVVTPSWVVRERVACPFTAQMPRNSATELSTTSFFLIILAGKGDIPEVVDQLKPLEDLHFHLNHENGMAEEDLKHVLLLNMILIIITVIMITIIFS